MRRIKVVGFDLFNTVVKMDAYESELRYYASVIAEPVWRPWRPEPAWERFEPFPDAVEGLARLSNHAMVVTCSNCPLGPAARMAKHGGLYFDAIIPLEMNKVYKPSPKAYMTVCEVMNVDPEEVMIVSANRHFGDLEAAEKLGMMSVLIRGTDWKYHAKDILDLESKWHELLEQGSKA